MTASDRALDLAIQAARAASEKLATNIVAIDVSDHLVITDAFVVASAANDRQVKGVVDGVEEALLKAGAKPIRREGERDGRWVLLDFGDVVVHVQHEEERSYYSLERLWKDCPVIELPEDAKPREEARSSFAAEWALSDSDDSDDSDNSDDSDAEEPQAGVDGGRA